MTRIQLATFVSSGTAPGEVPGFNTGAIIAAGLTFLGLLVLIGAFTQLSRQNKNASPKDAMNWLVAILIIVGTVVLVLGGAVWGVTSGVIGSFTG